MLLLPLSIGYKNTLSKAISHSQIVQAKLTFFFSSISSGVSSTAAAPGLLDIPPPPRLALRLDTTGLGGSGLAPLAVAVADPAASGTTTTLFEM